jgi:hypothetical protein
MVVCITSSTHSSCLLTAALRPTVNRCRSWDRWIVGMHVWHQGVESARVTYVRCDRQRTCDTCWLKLVANMSLKNP